MPSRLLQRARVSPARPGAQDSARKGRADEEEDEEEDDEDDDEEDDEEEERVWCGVDGSSGQPT